MIFTLLSVILVLLLINWIILIINRYRINIPGPLPLPILGNAHLFVAGPTEFINLLKNFSLEYGDAILMHLFSTPYVILSHPKYIEPILSSSDYITKGRAYRYLQQWLGQGLLTSTGKQWKTHRKLLTPAFHFHILQLFLPIFCNHIKVLVEELRKKPKGSDIDLFPVVALAALDIVTETIMGISVNAQKNDKSEYVTSTKTATELSAIRTQLPFLSIDVIFNLLPMKTRYDKAINFLHAQTNKVINTRREELKTANTIGINNKKVFLDLMLLAEVDGKKIDPQSVSDEVNTFMFEGHDTTATVISWTLFALSRHKDEQEKIYAELQTIFGDDMDRDPTYYELHEMKYLELVIKESMRLYPAGPLIERLIEKDCQIGDFKLLKGTSVLINIFQMHRHPELYSDPLKFKPERFKVPLTNPFNWLGFSAGPRNCIGQKFAMMAVKVAISEMIKNFIVMPSTTEPIISAELVLKSKNGIHVKLCPRN